MKGSKAMEAFSPRRSQMAESGRDQISPLRRYNPAKQNTIRIVESGELKVLNGAKNNWDFSRDNSSHLKKHLHNLRF